MQLQIISIITALLAVGQALPTLDAVSANLDKRGENYRGDSTFENRVSNASPTVGDCQQIARNIAGMNQSPMTLQTSLAYPIRWRKLASGTRRCTAQDSLLRYLRFWIEGRRHRCQRPDQRFHYEVPMEWQGVHQRSYGVFQRIHHLGYLPYLNVFVPR